VIFWILMALLVFVIQAMLVPIARYLINVRGGVWTALGPRDNPPTMPLMGKSPAKGSVRIIRGSFGVTAVRIAYSTYNQRFCVSYKWYGTILIWPAPSVHQSFAT